MQGEVGPICNGGDDVLVGAIALVVHVNGGVELVIEKGHMALIANSRVECIANGLHP